MKKQTLCAALMAMCFGGTAFAVEIGTDYKQRLNTLVDRNIGSWLAFYKDFHQHPELGMEEVRTSAILAKEIRKLGFTVTEKVGNTGVVAIYKNGEGPLVMVRTEMDGLPVQELSGLPYASTAKAPYNGGESYLMHACGHDIHMAAWLGTAQALVDQKDKWKGTLMFVAQPAEEGRGGAKAMMADRIFERFGVPDHGFALHVIPAPYDSVKIANGVFNSYAGGFNITFNGRGGHGSRPNTTIDPIMMASKFVTDVQSVVSREKDPQQFGVVTVGTISGGNAGNVIPDSASVAGTVRWYEPDVGRKMLEGIERTAKSIVAQAGAPDADIRVRSGGTNVVNDSDLFASTQAAFAKLDGQVRTFVVGPETGSEDYGAFLKAFKSSMYFQIGGFDPALFDANGVPLADNVPSNHSPYFVPVPEPTLRTAVTAMTTAVFNVMAE